MIVVALICRNDCSWICGDNRGEEIPTQWYEGIVFIITARLSDLTVRLCMRSCMRIDCRKGNP